MVKKIYTHNFFIDCLERDGATLDKSKELPEHVNSNISCPYICKCGRPHSKRLGRINKEGALCIECKGSRKFHDIFALKRLCIEKGIELINPPNYVTVETNLKGFCMTKKCKNVWEKSFRCLDEHGGAYCEICTRVNRANEHHASVSTETTKRCSECKTFKDKECFGNDNSTWDGLTVCCKDCRKNRQDSLKTQGYYRDYHRERRKVDENFAMVAKLRGRLRIVTKCNGNHEKTKELTGISNWEHAVEYLKVKRNSHDLSYTKMDLDHIICCKAFDFTIREHRIACFHFTNLQYLPPGENQNLKKAKLPPDFDFDTWLQKQLVQIARIENEKLSFEDVLQLQKEGVFQGYITDEMKWW